VREERRAWSTCSSRTRSGSLMPDFGQVYLAARNSVDHCLMLLITGQTISIMSAHMASVEITTIRTFVMLMWLLFVLVFSYIGHSRHGILSSGHSCRGGWLVLCISVCLPIGSSVGGQSMLVLIVWFPSPLGGLVVSYLQMGKHYFSCGHIRTPFSHF
jgi:hypothetical protein